jgi:hypothetical protein
VTKKKMLVKKSWENFRKTGLLWWVNRTLHLFGWAIVLEYDDKDNVVGAYPCRSRFRGFHHRVEERNFRKLTRYLVKNADKLLEEANE